MRKKCLVLLMFFLTLGLLFLFANDVYASEGDAIINNNLEESKLCVNENVTISTEGYYEVYVNDKLIKEDVLLTKGYSKVKYITKTIKTEEVQTEDGTELVNVDVFNETSINYYLVNVDVEDGEVYFEQKEIILDEIDNVSYYLNDEAVKDSIVCEKEGKNELKIKCNDLEKVITFDIFKFEAKEELDGKNLYELVDVSYTLNTKAKVYLNGNLFDGKINTFGNYHFVVKNSKEEEIGNLSFVIDATIIINDKEYKALNSYIELETPIKLSTYAKIDYSLEPLTQKLSNNNIYKGYITYNPGMNTLNITGVGNYNLELKFSITPVTNIINNHSYVKEVLPIVSGGNVTINGYHFNLGTTITTAGSYEMVISGLEDSSVSTYHFDVKEEEFNINSSSFKQALIAVKANNYMLLNDNLYKSGDVISEIDNYELKIYYPTYMENKLNANPYNDDTYIKSKYYEIITYKFSIEAGLNIKSNTEYLDNVTILFSGTGTDTAVLNFEGNSISINSGYVASYVGNYVLEYNGNNYEFSITPSLNIEDSQIYLDNVIALKSYDFKSNRVNMALTCENGTKASSDKKVFKNDEILNKSLSSGTYSLSITTEYGYSKTVNFIVINKSIISRGSAYQNGKSFNIDMYGVDVYLNSPETTTRIRNTKKYNNENINTVGKHYFMFEYNGISTVSNLDTAIYFYVLPIVTINDEITTKTTLSSDLEATLTFKDGSGIDIENSYFDCLSLDNKSNQDQIKNNDSKYYFDEVGIHFIYLKLDGYNYNIKLTIDSYFYLNEIDSKNIITSTASETYLTTKNIFSEEVLFVNKANILSYSLDNKKEINGIKITEVGNHKLYLKGTNNYSKVLTFVLKENVLVNNELIELKESYDELVYKDAVAFNIIGDAEYLLDKLSYDNNGLVDTVGNHILTINGANNYSKNYKFQIKENLIVSLDNESSNIFLNSYTKDFFFTINYDKILDLKLNNEAINSEINIINKIGNYKLTILGTNSYASTYEFKVLPTLSFISSESNDNTFKNKYYDVLNIKINNDLGLEFIDATLNGNDYNFEEINDASSYKLVFNGVGGYKLEYKFDLIEKVLYSFDNINYFELNKNIIIDKEFIGKPIYLKKAYKDVNYNNIKLNDNIILDSKLADMLIVDTLGENSLKINNNTYIISLKELNDNLYLTKEEAFNNSINSIDEIKFIDELKYDIYLDEKLYEGNSVDSFGYHKVLVKGINYQNIYYFYINLNTNILNNGIYNSNVLIESNAKDVKIYSNQDLITDEKLKYVGTYLIKFNGLYDSKEEYTINLKSNLKINSNPLDDFETSDLINIKYVDGSNIYKNILLNGEIFNFDTINTIGKNILTLIDINNNEYDYELIINGKNYIKSNVYNNINLANNNAIDSFNLLVNDKYQASISLDKNSEALDFINNYYGLHEITINGLNDYEEKYYFSINLNSNISNDIYNDSIIANINANYLIDGNVVSSIDEVGNHKLVIKKQVIDQFEDEIIEFVIKEKVSGFDNINYDVIIPNVEGKIQNIKLSNISNYKLGDKINKAGSYTLTIYGVNDYVNTYEFKIIPTIVYKNYIESDINTNLVYIESNDVIFDLYLNGILFDINNPIDTIGNNTIRIEGYDYSSEKIIILNELLNIESNYNENDNFIPEVNNLKYQSIYLDGNLYDNLPITYFGNHILEIKGVNDYSKKYSFKINLNTNIINNEEYINSVNINSNSKIYVNDKLTNKANLIGNNIIKFEGLNLEEEYNILIKENIIGFDNDKYKASLLLRFENIKGIILDNNYIEANDYILSYEEALVGNHYFRIVGLNNYESKLYNFTIIEDANILENNNLFNNDVLIDIKNTNGLLLNGEKFENNNKVTLAGHYILTVLGLEGYTNNYEFDIEYNISGIEDGMTYYRYAKANSNNTIMYLDGNLYQSGDFIYSVGYHELKVIYNDFEKSYKFTILPDLSNNEIINEYDMNNVTIYDAKAFIVDPKAELSLTLNGKEYNGEVIDNVGRYEITLKGANSYQKTYTFTLDVNVEDINSIYNEAFMPIISNNLNYELLLNDKEYINGTLINNVGNYKLEIIGINYIKEYDFTIKEDLYYLNNDNYIKLNTELIYDNLLLINNHNNLLFKSILNGNELANLNSINTVGENILKIIGENGYEADYHIKLIEKLNVNNLDTYNDSDSISPMIINSLDAKILIDGNDESTIKGYGKHLITVKGVNYESNYNIYINLDSNVKANDSFIDYKVVNINSKFLLDEIEYDNVCILNTVGNHFIKVLGYGDETFEFSFVIKEKVSGVLNNETYNDSICPRILNASLLLDGKPYISETYINLVGNHVLEVLGTNGYKNVYKFTINNKKFVDNQILAESLLIDIPYAQLLLDGKEIENNSLINEVGNHTLNVMGTNGYSNEYHFTINNKKFVDNQVVLGSLLIDIPNAILYVDGNKIENNTSINEVGYHTLTVIGTNNYSNEYKFTITPDTLIVQTETERGIIANINANNECQSIKIDDVYYEAGMSYSNIGNHTLTILGANGYEYNESFTIDARIGVKDEGIYKDKLVINLLDANEITLDGIEMTKDVVISNGTHTLTILGANGYEKTVTFTYYNPNNMFVILCTISLLIVATVTPFALLFMKKRKGIK